MRGEYRGILVCICGWVVGYGILALCAAVGDLMLIPLATKWEQLLFSLVCPKRCHIHHRMSHEKLWLGVYAACIHADALQYSCRLKSCLYHLCLQYLITGNVTKIALQDVYI